MLETIVVSGLVQGGLKGSSMMLCTKVYREFVATRELLI